MICAICGTDHYGWMSTSCPMPARRVFLPELDRYNDRASIVAWLREQGLLASPDVIAARDRWADAIEAGVDRRGGAP